MPRNLFSMLMEQDVSVRRKVEHSGRDYVKAFFSKQTGPVDKVVAVGKGGENVYTAVQVGGNIAQLAVGMSAAVAAIANPIGVIVMGSVALALLAKDTYSNREAAHNDLFWSYAWNLIDDVPPEEGKNFSKPGLERAGKAALTLLDDGKSQIAILGDKLQAATNKWDHFHNGFKQTCENTRGLPDGSLKSKEMDKLSHMWYREIEVGGVIFEFVRRLAHTGNYLQAPHILGLAMKEKFFPGSVAGKEQPDFFLGNDRARTLRDGFSQLSQLTLDALPQLKSWNLAA